MSSADTAARNRRVGATIRRRRQALGWEQRELAARVGVHVNSVQKWEAGTHYPGRKLGKLEAVLGICVDDGLAPVPEPDIPDTLMAQIRQDLAPEDQAAVIEAIRQTLAGTTPPGAEGRSAARRRAG